MPTDARTLDPDKVARLVEPVMRRWPVREAWVYGSVARGTQQADSDVDITFELVEGARMGWEILGFSAGPRRGARHQGRFAHASRPPTGTPCVYEKLQQGQGEDL